MKILPLQFLLSVIGLIDKSSLVKSEGVGVEEAKLCSDLRAFVASFLFLREVEKKALKDWDNPVTNSSLRQTLAELLSKDTAFSTSRYSGGAKERAEENAINNSATSSDMAILDGHACAWCGKRLGRASFQEGVQSTYCSIECAEEGRLRRGGMYASTQVRAQVFALERGVCTLCSVDAYALFLRIKALQPAERLNVLCNANWKLPQSGPALERLLHQPKEGDFWQADHIEAVAEGGGSCGLKNLRTLCVPCHKNETEKLRSRLRLCGGRASPSDANAGGPGQMDIRSAFMRPQCMGSSGSELALQKERKKRRRTAD